MLNDFTDSQTQPTENMNNSVGVSNNVGISFKDRLKQSQQLEERLRDKTRNNIIDNGFNNVDYINESRSTTTNAELNRNLEKAGKKEKLANGLRNYLVEEGYDLEKFPEKADDLLDMYLYSIDDDDVYNYAYNTMYDFVNQYDETDPTPYYKRLGWWISDEEEETKNRLQRVWGDFVNAYDIAGKGFRNLETALAKYVGDTDGEKEAIQEYAYDKYGHIWSKVTDDERAEIERDIRIDPSILDKYMDEQRADYAAADIVAGTAFATLETLAMSNPLTAGLTIGMFGAAETPGLHYIPDILMLLTKGLGEIPYDVVAMITKLVAPDVYNYLIQFPDEKKDNLFMLAGGMIFGSYLKTEGGKKFKTDAKQGINRVWKGMKDFFKKPENQMKIIENMEQMQQLKNEPTNIDEIGTELDTKDAKKIEKLKQKRDMKAAKTIDPEAVYENRQASEALSQIEPETLKNNKTFADMEKTMEGEIKYDVAQQDALLDTIDTRFSTDTELSRPLESRGRVSDRPRKPIKKWFSTMWDWVKFQFDEEALDILQRDADEGKLSTKDVKNMARALSYQFEIWKKGKSADEIAKGKAKLEATRQELNELVRQTAIGKGFDLDVGNIIEYYDRKMSPKIKLRNTYRGQKNKVNRAKAAFADKTLINKLFSLSKYFTSKGRAAQAIINELGGEDVMNALRRENNLPRAIKEFLELDEKIGESASAREKARVVEEWLREYTNKEIPEEYGGYVEGEVIEPDWATANKSENPYLNELLDSVKVEKPESFMIGEDASRVGVNPVDYTTKTRITPEGNAARDGQTLEQTKGEYREGVKNPESPEPTMTQMDAWKYNLKKMGFTEEGIKQTIDELKKEGIIKQESLFGEGDVGGGKRKDFLGRDKSKK